MTNKNSFSEESRSFEGGAKLLQIVAILAISVTVAMFSVCGDFDNSVLNHV